MKYTRPPLPFMGSKVAMLKPLKRLLENMQSAGQLTKETIFYDLFGGSGLLSHNLKQWYPNNRVIWNDFDNYQERLENIYKTESIRAKLYALCKEIPNKKQIPESLNVQIANLLKKEEYLDFISLSAYLFFSANYYQDEQFFNYQKYNNIPKTPLCAKGYLEGVERVSLHFLDLLESIPQEQKEKGIALLILDPPYLQTQKGNYRDCYTLKDFCALVERIWKPYVLFSSQKSDILDFLEFYKKYNPVFENFSLESKKLFMCDDRDFMISSCTQKGLFESLD